jgi:hypothetical protein
LLLPERLRSIGPNRHPSLESVGTHAVHAISKHSDETHAAVLAVIRELLTIGARDTPVAPVATVSHESRSEALV